MSDRAVARCRQSLKQHFPIARVGQAQTIRAIIGEKPDVVTEPIYKFVTRDRTSSIAFKTDAIVIETTNYQSRKVFREACELAVSVRQDVDAVDGLERVGLRYVNEIRLGSVASVADWRGWLDPSLIGASEIAAELGYAPTQGFGVAQFDTGAESSVTLRYGSREGFAVEPGGDLKRPTPAPGLFFLLDIDSFWTADGEIPELDPTSFHDLFEKLHLPCKLLFERVITEQMREVFRSA